MRGGPGAWLGRTPWHPPQSRHNALVTTGAGSDRAVPEYNENRPGPDTAVEAHHIGWPDARQRKPLQDQVWTGGLTLESCDDLPGQNG